MLLSGRWSERSKRKYKFDLIRKLGERKGAGDSFDRGRVLWKKGRENGHIWEWWQILPRGAG
jgi:hypothetical protein